MMKLSGFLMFLCAALLNSAAHSTPTTPKGTYPADPPNREWARLRRFEANSPVDHGSYGEGIAISEDVLAIGSPGGSNGVIADSGLVEVWKRVNGSWAFAQYLTDPTPISGSKFGASVASCGGGRYIVVGAPEDGKGTAYVFALNVAGIWVYEGALNDSAASAGARIGYAVSIDCDDASSVIYAAIGAPFDDVGGTNWAGSIAIWKRQTSGATWIKTQRMTPHANANGARCGISLALSYAFNFPLTQRAGRLLFGCPFVDYSGVNASGVAYVYDRTGDTFSLEQTLGPPAPDSDGEYGTSVAMFAGNAAVGAPWAPHSSIGDAGRVWVWQRIGVSPLLWQSTELVVDDYFSTTAQYFYGGDLAIANDSRGIHVFASRIKTLYVSGGRCWYVLEAFSKADSSSPWVRSDRLASPDIEDGYDILGFGSGVAASGSDIAVGAHRSTVDDLSDAGAAYVFRHERVFGSGFELYQQTE